MELTRERAVLENVFPILIGCIAFFVVVGWDVLCFDNIGWLQGDTDSAQHYLGWLFYRYTPWTLPICSNPNFGLEISSSVFYSDSIPFLAVFFKLLSPLLPEPFQYFGLWYLLCFVLQAWFACRLVGLITDNLLIKLCASGLFVFSPPMLNRLICHSSLVGHWLILAGIYLCLSEASSRKKWQWLVVAVIACLTHAYLLAMVLVLWLSDTVKRLISKETKLGGIAIECVLMLTGVLLTLWQAGCFLVKSGLGIEGSYGYGVYKLNLLSLVNPNVAHFFGKHSFSLVLPDLPLRMFEAEGFSFLGLGVIVVFIVVLPKLMDKLRNPRLEIIGLPLLVSCFGLFLFAITNKVGVGSAEFVFWIPETILKAGNIFRSSGRMFWPVFYLIIWCLIFVLIHSYDKKTVLVIVFVAFSLQVIDTTAGWWSISRQAGDRSNSWNTNFVSPFWSQAFVTYKKIRLFPPLNLSPLHLAVGYAAGTNKLGTDAAYLARYDVNAQEQLMAYYDNIFNTGDYDLDTLYIYDERYVSYAVKSVHDQADLFTMIDGYYVVAPRWKQKHS